MIDTLREVIRCLDEGTYNAQERAQMSAELRAWIDGAGVVVAFPASEARALRNSSAFVRECLLPMLNDRLDGEGVRGEVLEAATLRLETALIAEGIER
jgi:hypothetical protein